MFNTSGALCTFCANVQQMWWTWMRCQEQKHSYDDFTESSVWFVFTFCEIALKCGTCSFQTCFKKHCDKETDNVFPGNRKITWYFDSKNHVLNQELDTVQWEHRSKHGVAFKHLPKAVIMSLSTELYTVHPGYEIHYIHIFKSKWRCKTTCTHIYIYILLYTRMWDLWQAALT